MLFPRKKSFFSSSPMKKIASAATKTISLVSSLSLSYFEVRTQKSFSHHRQSTYNDSHSPTFNRLSFHVLSLLTLSEYFPLFPSLHSLHPNLSSLKMPLTFLIIFLSLSYTHILLFLRLPPTLETIPIRMTKNITANFIKSEIGRMKNPYRTRKEIVEGRRKKTGINGGEQGRKEERRKRQRELNHQFLIFHGSAHIVQGREKIIRKFPLLPPSSIFSSNNLLLLPTPLPLLPIPIHLFPRNFFVQHIPEKRERKICVCRTPTRVRTPKNPKSNG